MECKEVLPNSDLSDLKFPKGKKNDKEIELFIKTFRGRLKKNQIDLLRLMSKNVYSFHLNSHSVESARNRFDGTRNTCEFRFSHGYTEGSITIKF